MSSKKQIKAAAQKAVENICCEGITDVYTFNNFFEIDYLRKDKDSKGRFVSALVDAIEDAQSKGNIIPLKLHHKSTVLIPKKNLADFRKCSLLDIWDEATFLTLVLLLSSKIEGLRISCAKKTIYSYRIKKSMPGRVFNSDYTWTAFNNRVHDLEKRPNNKVMVRCDIANYYDRVNIHRIISKLYSIDGIDSTIVNLVDEVLKFWANRDSYGLPVGSNASRILAEVALMETDNDLENNQVTYCRFVDDFAIFTSDAIKAHSILALLVERLAEEGLSLNQAKTRIHDISGVKAIATATVDDGSENSLQNPSFNVNTADLEGQESSNAQRKNAAGVISGYSGLIPMKFREPSECEREKLLKNDYAEMINSAKSCLVLEPKAFSDLMKTAYVQQIPGSVIEIANLLIKFPQFFPFFVDMVLKEPGACSNEDMNNLREMLESWLTDKELPEYLRIHATRFFGDPRYKNIPLLEQTFYDMNRDAGDYLGRAILDTLIHNTNRSNALKLRRQYARSNLIERRAILEILKESLPDAEYRAFFKDIQMQEHDFFITEHFLRMRSKKS